VNVVDANVLLYAINESDDKHERSRAWLDDALNGQTPVGFAWITLLAFVRLSTKVGLFPSPLAVDDALERVQAWMTQAPSVVLEPTTRHLAVLAGLLREVGAGGNLVNDAHLAALAIEHGATIITYDTDFGRFPGVESRPPPP
jgi:uncharacterized protein